MYHSFCISHSLILLPTFETSRHSYRQMAHSSVLPTQLNINVLVSVQFSLLSLISPQVSKSWHLLDQTEYVHADVLTYMEAGLKKKKKIESQVYFGPFSASINDETGCVNVGVMYFILIFGVSVSL